MDVKTIESNFGVLIVILAAHMYLKSNRLLIPGLMGWKHYFR
jgi:hypothetical protein